MLDTKPIEEHADERQIKLDTDRSFVLYPVGEIHILLVCQENVCSSAFGIEDLKEKELLQGELHELIVEIFRRRRRLSYFQVRC